MQLSLGPRPALAGAAVLAVAAAVVVGSLLVAPGAPVPSPSPTATASPSPTPSPSPSPSPSPTPSPSPSPSPTPVAVCPYNGLPLADPAMLDRTAFLAQVENHPLGRPTSGLNAADLVIEAPVEGDTTRFGAVYLCSDAPAAIGPVRSARYYNTDLWRQVHAITAHYGAGWKILQQFDRTRTPYVNGIAGEWPFLVRRGSRPAPHNVYFDLALARRMAADGRLGDRVARAGEPRAPFTFEPQAALPAGRRVASVLMYTNNYWNFGWTWDAGSGAWLRNEDGARAVDALTGRPLSARTVVVQLVEQTILHNEPDPGGYPRRRQHLVGSGNGILYADGQARTVRWSRPADGDVTSWTYADNGEPVVLQPGRVWWEIIPVGSSITER